METTLLAVTGLSPAIVTETLWALAHENPCILPNRVVLLTTLTGAEKLESQLFSPLPEWGDRTVWDTLRTTLEAGEDQLIADPIQVISMSDGTAGRAVPLDDIRTPAENAATAEFLFSQVWDVVRNKDRRLIVSIAGGRKTMGALLHAAVSLIGRESDRVTHVLVSPPFETLPGFFFPAQPGLPLMSNRDAGVYDPANARLQLADVPFVPLRNRFPDLEDLPQSFLTLRDELTKRLAVDADRPVQLRIDHSAGTLGVDGENFVVRPRALVILHYVLLCNQEGAVPTTQQAAAEDFRERVKHDPHIFGPISFPGIDDSDFRRELNYLRDMLHKAAWKPVMRSLRQSPFLLKVLADTVDE